jgi:hypothetical protein
LKEAEEAHVENDEIVVLLCCDAKMSGVANEAACAIHVARQRWVVRLASHSSRSMIQEY